MIMDVEEEHCERSFYDEDCEASPKEPSRLEEQLKRISRCFRPFDVINEIKDSFREKLNKRISREVEFDGFQLGTMAVLNSVRRDNPVEKFLREAYIGCFHCLLCLQIDDELSNTSERLLHFLYDALNVIGRVLSEQGFVLPNLNSEERDYEKDKLVHLNEQTDLYLQSRPDYEQLREHVQLIKDFEIVSEIERALNHLRDEFEELRRQPHKESRVSQLMLFSQMEENDDLSWWCC